MKKLFTNANIVDSENLRVFAGSVLVEDGIITAVGDNLPAQNAQIVDLKGATLLPGLFNCHTHITMAPNPDPTAQSSDVQCTLLAINHLKQYLQSGVTFIRDVGAYSYIDVALRNEIAKGTVAGPDILGCGQCVCMTGGHGWSMGGEADGVAECRKVTRKQLKNGVDWVKIMATGGVLTKGVEPGSPQLTIEEMRACVEEAHKAGVKTCTHAQGNTGIKNALKAGLDSIEHGCFLDDESIEMMKNQGTWLVATLCAPHFIMENATNGIPDWAVRKCAYVYESHMQSFAKAYQAGVNVASGTDAGTPFNGHDNSGYELILMVKQGLTPLQAIQVATLNSAKMLNVDDSLGSICVGKKAHFAIFNGDPTQNIEDIMNCAMTVKNGDIVYQASC